MSKLEREIKRLERTIEREKESIDRNYALLKQDLGTPLVISLGLITSFVAGYLMLRNKSSRHFLRNFSFTLVPSIIKHTYKNL